MLCSTCSLVTVVMTISVFNYVFVYSGLYCKPYLCLQWFVLLALSEIESQNKSGVIGGGGGGAGHVQQFV